MTYKFKIRDLLATPFLFIALVLEYIAVLIGGEWTSELYKKKLNK